ncbi:hypothetical protein RCL1_005761 [Eukaryota sp. TZLM3-RCL]
MTSRKPTACKAIPPAFRTIFFIVTCLLLLSLISFVFTQSFMSYSTPCTLHTVPAANSHETTTRFNQTLSPFICHALGKVGKVSISNTLEAFLLNYYKGCRTFEADFHQTSDGEFVVYHKGKAVGIDPSSFFGYPESGSHADFMSSHMAGLTQLDMKGMVKLFLDFPDWLLVTDTKNDLKSLLTALCGALDEAGLNCVDRVIPQLYNFNDLEVAKSFGFTRTILTLYKMKVENHKIIKFLEANPEVIAVTFFPNRYPPLKKDLLRLGIKTFTHTIDDPKDVLKFQEDGIYGVYTNSLCAGF